MSALLDSSRLINIKNRYGIKIVEGNSVSTYSAQCKLRKFLIEQLNIVGDSIPAIKHPANRVEVIEKIVLKAKDFDKIEAVYELWSATTPEQFIAATRGSSRAFFTIAMDIMNHTNTMKKMSKMFTTN